LPNVITPDELQAVTLDRHFLLSAPLPEQTTEAIGQICGLNAQSARAPYLSLWSRMDGFRREILTEALYEEKTLIKTWLMRGTVHIVPTADFPVYQRALRRSLCDGWETSLKKQTLIAIPRTWSKLLDAIMNSLGEGPLVKKDLAARVKGLMRSYTEREQKRLVGWALRLLSYRGLVCHDRPTGPWYHFKDNRFAPVSLWLEQNHVEAVDEDEARHDLLLKYLGGYGPATIRDFAYWAGFKMPEARQVLESARKRLCRISLKDGKAELWVRAEEADYLKDREPKQPVCFLPEFDPLVMGHKDKSRIMDEDARKRVFLRLATVAPTLLVEGRVAGTWDYSFPTGALDIKPFKAFSAETRKAVEPLARRLREFLAT
jgi:uncharacterized protein YcaQ